MSWVELPPRLRGRVRSVGVLEALIPLIATPLFSALLVFGPPVFLVVAWSRGDHLLAAVLAVPVLAWCVAMIREPVALGMLFAWPFAARSAFQQWRGRVDTEDLEHGRLVGLAQWRALSAPERQLVDLLVGSVDAPALRAKAASAEVMAECVCGCPSIRLYATSPSLPPDHPLAEADLRAWAPDDRGRRIDVALHVRLGSLHELEVTVAGEHRGEPAELPPASAMRVAT